MNSFEDSFVRNLQTLESGLLDHSKRISDIETKISVAENAIENYQQINS
jgi:hypothetical protein